MKIYLFGGRVLSANYARARDRRNSLAAIYMCAHTARICIRAQHARAYINPLLSAPYFAIQSERGVYQAVALIGRG